jgi:photosystem II stability/assembly factor-like uncharacterized protein
VKRRVPAVLSSFVIIGAAIVLRSVSATANVDRDETGQPVAVSDGPAHWINIGPSPLTFLRTPTDPANLDSSGRVAAIAVHPTNPSRWLIGAGNGGVWQSRDAGTSWVPLTDTAPTLAIGAVAFAPSNPDVVYAGTGEAASVGFAKAGLGMLKSTDGGSTWTLLAGAQLARASVRRVRIHPGNPNVLLAATSRGGFGRDSQEGAPLPVGIPLPFGILSSSDGGATWIRTLPGQATALEINPGNFALQYAAIGDQRLGVLTDSPGSVANGVYRSTNSGQNWDLVPGPWGTGPSPTTSTVGRIELAIAPSDPDVLYASIQIPPNGGSSATGLLGLYRTDNAWDPAPTWIQIPTGATGLGGYCGPTKCGYSHVISVDPNNPNRLFAGGAEQGLWRCTNCGASASWTNVTLNSGVHSDHHALAWAGNRLIDGNDGGVWSTTDFGGTWQNHNHSLSTSLFFSGSLHPSSPNVILGGIRDFQPSILGEDSVWTVLPQIATGEWGEAEVALSSERPNTDWMVGWIFGAIQRTTDGGLTGIRADTGIDKTGAAFVAPVRKCPTNDDVFVTGTNRMWRTENFFSGVQPTWVSNGPVHPFASPNALRAPGTILAIAFAPTGVTETPCSIYAAGNRGGEIQLTRNGGGTWTDLDALRTLPARPVNGLAFDPTSPDTLYVALSSFDDATFGRPGHVFKTVNALAAAPTWVNVSPPIDVPFNVITVDPGDPLLVYAGTDTGLWRSSDGAATWVRMGPETGLPNVAIHDIQINPTTETTVVFTYGRGAFLLTTDGTTLEPPTDLHVTSVVGNTVTIAFTAPSDGLTPTGYVLEGGVLPGQVLASIPTGSTETTFTFNAPTGAFYIRVHSVAGATRSEASNEIRIVVNMAPSPPANLLALVNGSSVALAWMNTIVGGPPTRLILDVTGSVTTALSLPVAESFSVASVPAGTYTLALRAENGGGVSGPSNTVTVSVPGACSGAPGTPPDLVATKNGNVITVAWGLPVTGPAPTGYTIVVTGSFTGTIPVAGRSASGAVGPGSYTISIVATNPCGPSAATPTQTVTIP